MERTGDTPTCMEGKGALQDDSLGELSLQDLQAEEEEVVEALQVTHVLTAGLLAASRHPMGVRVKAARQ